MITTSADYKTEVWQNDNRQFLHYAVVTLTDGTVINLDNTNIWQGGFRLEEAVSSSSAMEVGACIASELTLIINNIDGDYDGTDFEGASVVASIGLMINGTEERFQRGVYTVDEMEYTGSLITLTCLDAMVKLDKDYSLSALTYPATLAQIVSDVCTVCGVTLVSNDFPNSSYVVKERPDNDTLTCREVLSCALQIGCSNGHINPLGELEISSYELGVGSTSTWNDIGSLTWDGLANFTWNALPYPTGDSFNGGTFWVDADDFDGGTFWTDADDFDGGAFLNLPDMDFTLTGYSSFKVDFRRCTFTGVEVIVGDNSVLAGNDTYVLKVENNVLVNDPVTVASLMRPYILGLTFWPYEAEHLSDPSLQAGDSVLVIDRKGNEYRTFATNITYSAGNYETTGCYAQSYPRNESNRYSSAAVAEARAVSTTNKYIDLMANSFGLYRSEIPDPVITGAYTYALHNASTYETSTFAMIANAQGLFMQTRSTASAEWTTTASVASDGDALVNVLTAIGINADWINAGTLSADRVYGGTINGNNVNVTNLNASNISSGSLSANYISGGTLKLGGAGNGNGIAQIYDANSSLALELNRMGMVINRTYTFYASDYTEADRTAVQQILLGNVTPTAAQLNKYDLNGDGMITSIDALRIAKFLNGTESSYTINANLQVGSTSSATIIETPGVHIRPGGMFADSGGFGTLYADIIIPKNQTTTPQITVNGTLEVGTLKTTLIQSGDNNLILNVGSGSYVSIPSAYSHGTTVAPNMVVASNGYLYRSASSSKRYKHDITDKLDEDPERLYGVRVVQFKYNDDYISKDDQKYGKDIVGFIAEDVAEAMPGAVEYDDEGRPEMWNVHVIVPAMMELIKRQKAKIDDLEARLSALEERFYDDGR